MSNPGFFTDVKYAKSTKKAPAKPAPTVAPKAAPKQIQPDPTQTFLNQIGVTPKGQGAGVLQPGAKNPVPAKPTKPVVPINRETRNKIKAAGNEQAYQDSLNNPFLDKATSQQQYAKGPTQKLRIIDPVFGHAVEKDGYVNDPEQTDADSLLQTHYSHLLEKANTELPFTLTDFAIRMRSGRKDDKMIQTKAGGTMTLTQAIARVARVLSVPASEITTHSSKVTKWINTIGAQSSRGEFDARRSRESVDEVFGKPDTSVMSRDNLARTLYEDNPNIANDSPLITGMRSLNAVIGNPNATLRGMTGLSRNDLTEGQRGLEAFGDTATQLLATVLTGGAGAGASTLARAGNFAGRALLMDAPQLGVMVHDAGGVVPAFAHIGNSIKNLGSAQNPEEVLSGAMGIMMAFGLAHGVKSGIGRGVDFVKATGLTREAMGETLLRSAESLKHEFDGTDRKLVGETAQRLQNEALAGKASEVYSDPKIAHAAASIIVHASKRDYTLHGGDTAAVRIQDKLAMSHEVPGEANYNPHTVPEAPINPAEIAPNPGVMFRNPNEKIQSPKIEAAPKADPLNQAPKSKPKGSYIWDEATQKGILTLNSNADASTVIHELQHHFLQTASSQTKAKIASWALKQPTTPEQAEKIMAEGSKNPRYVRIQESFAYATEQSLKGKSQVPPDIQEAMDAFRGYLGSVKQAFVPDEVNLNQKLEQGSPQTKTKEFRDWFGDSKVVDEKGEPLVVYHGTPVSGHTEFRPDDFMTDSRAAYGKGVYVTESSEAGSGYTKSGSSWNNGTLEGESPGVYPLHAKAVKPFDLDANISLDEARKILPKDSDALHKMEREHSYEGRSDLEEDINTATAKLEEVESIEPHNPPEWLIEDHRISADDFERGTKDPDFIKEVEDAIAWEKKSLERDIARKEKLSADDYEAWKSQKKEVSARDVWKALWEESDGYSDFKNESQLFGGETENIEFKTEANRRLQELGYDSLTHMDSYNPGGKDAHRVYILFEPNQVKSAIANSGKFDPKNPSILHHQGKKTKLTPHDADFDKLMGEILGGEITADHAKAFAKEVSSVDEEASKNAGAMTHAQTAVVREVLGAELYQKTVKPDEQTIKNASKFRGKADQFAARLEDGKPLSDSEQIALGLDYQDSLRGRQEILDKYAPGQDLSKEDAQALADHEYNALNAIRTLDKAGSEAGRSLRIRQLVLGNDYTNQGITAAFVKASGKMPDRAQSAKIAELTARIEELESKVGKVTKARRVKYDEAIKFFEGQKNVALNQLSEADRHANAIAIHLMESGMTATEAVAKMQSLTGGKVRGSLATNAVKKALAVMKGKNTRESVKAGEPTPQEINAARGKIYNAQMELADIISAEGLKTAWKEAGIAGKTGIALRELRDSAVSVVSSTDFSGTRQALYGLLVNPKSSGRTFLRQFKNMKTSYYDEWIAGLQSEPQYWDALDNGLDIHGKPNFKEEAFRGRAIEKVPGIGQIVGASDRTYSTVTTGVRYEVYKTLAKYAKTKAEKQLIADFANIVTGRAGSGKLKTLTSGELPRSILWAPSFMASRMQHIALPVRILRSSASVGVKARLLGEWAKPIAAISGIMYGVARVTGGKFIDDRDDKDFLAVILPDGTKYDPWAGSRQVVRLGLDMINPQRKGEWFDQGKDQIKRVFDFTVEGKANPMFKTGMNLARRHDTIGGRFGMKEAALGFLPLTVRQTAEDAMDENGMTQQDYIGCLGNTFGVFDLRDKKSKEYYKKNRDGAKADAAKPLLEYLTSP